MKKLTILRLLHYFLWVAPVTYFTVSAFILGEVHEKVTLGLTLMLVLMLTLFGIVRKHNLLSPFYFMVVAINLIIDNLMVLFFILAITSFLDELIIIPLLKKERRKVEILKVVGNANEKNT